MNKKQRVLFVGAFQAPVGSQLKGGQLYACQTILRSKLSEHVEWVLVDSTMESVPPPLFRRRLWRAARRIGCFTKFLACKKIDVVLIFASNGGSFYEKGVMVALARAVGKRVVFCPRSGFLLDDYRRSRVMRWVLPRVCRMASVVVCQGTAWKSFFSETTGLPESRLPVIMNSIEAEGYLKLCPTQNRQPIKVLLMGWIERNKGIYDLVATVDRFRSELSGVRIIICGRGAEWDALLALIAEKNLGDYFELRGWVNDVQKLAVLEDTDIYLMLSHREGLPNALLEAMASGRASIATAVGAIPDVIDDRRTGILCAPGDVEAIGRELVALSRDFERRAAIGQAARQAILKNHDAATAWQQWLAVISG